MFILGIKLMREWIVVFIFCLFYGIVYVEDVLLK